ncbi:MAG: amino acid racemase [Proteobacteria bacterium]|nr:amino acid racemase [Pseudomonadota bacterium]
MKKIKHIGIAAITAEGAALAYRHICQEAQKILGKNTHPEITLHSFSFSDYFKNPEHRLRDWQDLICNSAEKLAATGADFFICPSNTNHEVYDLVKDRLAIPWISIAEAVRKQVVKKQLSKVALLGTIYTMQSDIYTKIFSASGIEIAVPCKERQEEIHRIIYQELLLNIITPESKKFLLETIDEMSEQNCHGVILACTELPMIISRNDCSIEVFDSTFILAKEAVDYALI